MKQIWSDGFTELEKWVSETKFQLKINFPWRCLFSCQHFLLSKFLIVKQRQRKKSLHSCLTGWYRYTAWNDNSWLLSMNIERVNSNPDRFKILGFLRTTARHQRPVLLLLLLQAGVTAVFTVSAQLVDQTLQAPFSFPHILVFDLTFSHMVL